MSVDTRVRADLPMEDIDAFRLGLANQNRISDRVKLAREIAARTEPRFIEIKPEPRRRTRASSFAEIPRQRGGGRVPLHRGRAYGNARRAYG